MSQLAETVDAIVALLKDTTPLADAKDHRYAPWSVEKLKVQPGDIHLAAWPVADVESATGIATGAHELEQVFEVLIWEDASESGTRGLDNDAANLGWLELYETVRALWYFDSRQTLGGGNVSLTWFIGGEFGVEGSTRWFRQRIRASVFQAFVH